MKSGSLFLTLVLLIAFAIPLFADHALGNTVGESSAMSIPWKEEVPVKDVSAPYSLQVGLFIKPVIPLSIPALSRSRVHPDSLIYPCLEQKQGAP